MKALPAWQTAALPPRALLALTAMVMLAHVLLLEAAPAQWGVHTQPAQAALRPLVTRTITIKPVPAATAATAAPVAPPQAPRARRLQQNRAPALVPQEPIATESIAIPVETAPPVASPAPAVPEATPPPAAAGPALSIPGSTRFVYTMTGRSKGMDYNAAAELNWLQDGQNYEAKMSVSALFLGARSMSSSGRITADGLAPTRFSDKSRSERATHFDADKGKITFSANTPDAPWLRGAQDRVSVFLQLASLMAGDPAKYPPGSTVSLYTAGPREVDTWTFTVKAPEKLSLPMGEVEAVKLQRKPLRDYDQTIEIWLAPSLDWLPVRNRITQHNGDFVDQQLRVAARP